MRLAEDLLGSCGIHTPPVDVLAVARHLGVRVVEVSTAAWDSALDVGSATLYVTRTLTATRTRFAIAHGLGHAHLHQGKQAAFRERFESPRFCPYELEANLFALRLLAPWSWAEAYCIYESPDQVAARFGVTRAVLDAARRLRG
jgi:Zn-dependent peptidase ImmA (M78 family)